MTAQQQLAVDTATLDTNPALRIEDITADNAPAVFGHHSLNRFVELVRAQVINEVPDLSTATGRKRIASLAATVARSKTAVDDKGRDYLRVLKAQPKVIEAELREFNAAMDALRDEVRKPLTDWEARQEAAKQALQGAIAKLEAHYTQRADASAETLRGALAALEQEPVTAEVFGARLEEAQAKHAYGIDLLTEQLAKRVQYEADQVELAEARRKIAALEEAKRLEQVKQQAIDDERRRVDEQNRQEQLALERAQREAAQRAADRVHRGKVNKAALDAILTINMAAEGQPAAYLNPVMAAKIVTAIVRGQVPAVTITY